MQATPDQARGGGHRSTDGETVAPTGRFATLWVRPGAQGTPTPQAYLLPQQEAGRPRRRMLAGAALVGGAALAWAASVALGVQWSGRARGPEMAAGAATPVALTPPAEASPAPAPVARPTAEEIPEAPARPRVPGFVPKEARPAGRRALAASAGLAGSKTALVNPTPEDRGCVPRALRARKDLADKMPSEIAVRLRVAASGDVGQIEVLNPPDRQVVRAIDDAVRSCRFSPGTDEEGHPVSLPIVMRIRFATPEATAGF